ncbi:cell division protein FtsI [alpha proteobacterium U9-1i]|nr:cell division protein FtsI [alpha proteobacterium U9-1i]
MRPFSASALAPSFDAPAAEVAPARNRVRFLAIGILAVLMLLTGRAVQLAFSGDPIARQQRAAQHVIRADLVDRNGVLLATTVRAYALTAAPANVRDPEATANALIALLPRLNREDTMRRLTDASRRSIFLTRGLTPEERAAVEALNLRGIGFETQDKRVYPNGTLAAHALGFTDVDLNPLAGAERGLDEAIREASQAGHPLALSLDIRMQYALETELEASARAMGATGAAAILLDGRSGETLALASWPAFDPNEAGRSGEAARRDRVSGDVHELGSTIKPFTVAMALEAQMTSGAEVFDFSQPFAIDGNVIRDHEPAVHGLAGLREIMTHSSNIGAARLALRLGADRQRDYLGRLGLLAPSPLQTGRNQAPLAPAPRSRRDVAGVGFGYGLATTPAALAGAYTIFANNGALVAPTLLHSESGEAPERIPVFSAPVTRQVLSYMRAAVVSGTGRAADVPGLAIAGKTGTAEKLGEDAEYDDSRNFSSFAGVFPAQDPRYVIVVSLDDVGAGEAGGVAAAPVVARTLRRIAPMLGMNVTRD